MFYCSCMFFFWYEKTNETEVQKVVFINSLKSDLSSVNLQDTTKRKLNVSFDSSWVSLYDDQIQHKHYLCWGKCLISMPDDFAVSSLTDTINRCLNG